jgi:protein TonB
MSRADLSSPRATRLGVAVLVAAMHIAVVVLLIRAFAPGFGAAVSDRLTAVLTVDVAPPPSPSPTPSPSPNEPEPAGAAAEAGKRAVPREAAAPKPKLVIASPAPAPPVSGSGDQAASGARDSGSGTGAGGQGSGTGSGTGGNGQGGGASKAVKIAGDINSARDYPRETRELRLGGDVILALTVGADGKVKACRVHRPSRDPQSDRITCELAAKRFRFRPATDANGHPVESIYGWRQRWYDPRDGSR